MKLSVTSFIFPYKRASSIEKYIFKVHHFDIQSNLEYYKLIDLPQRNSNSWWYSNITDLKVVV